MYYIAVILCLLMYLLMIINDIFLKLCYVLYRGDFVVTDVVFIDDNK